MASPLVTNRLGMGVLKMGAAGVTDLGAPLSDCEPLRASYGAFISWSTFSANPTDVLTLTGSATKTVRLKSITLSGQATSASNVIIYLLRRSAANTGGTFTALTAQRQDTSDDNPTATVGYYTANPSGLGTLVGTVHGGRLNLAPAANGSIDRLCFQYSWAADKAPVLNGTSDIFAINLNGAAWPAGGGLDVDLLWSED